MKYPELRKLANRLYFNHEDVADVLGITLASAKVLCSRYTEKGLFIRLKKDLYILSERWQQISMQDFYRMSNILQVPSYISLMTALSYYEVTTQIQRGFIEAVCINRTLKKEIDSLFFYFYKIKKDLYFDFIKDGDFFIATKEKAFLDSIYLYSFGKYTFDIASIDLNKLDIKRVMKLLKKFPERTNMMVKRICRI
jgi:predicted transcriptional regulator of viral defense system